MSDHAELKEIARKARIDALTMIYHAGSGHPGGSLSAMDALCWLFFREMRRQPGAPDWPERDRFVLSKGHACPALYAVARWAGDIPPGELRSFRKIGGALQGHPHAAATPWAETSTGSLGQGFSFAIGAALGLRHRGMPGRVFAMLGDGELQEGEIWEGAMFAAHHRLNRLCAILDYNKMQSDDLNENIMGLEPLAAKWRAFGWRTLEIDGHDFDQIADALAEFNEASERPTMIIAHTIKGKGVGYMEGVPTWHGSVKLTEDDLRAALADLGCDQAATARCLSGAIWEEAA